MERLRERFPGVDVTLGQSIYGGSSSGKKKRPRLTKSKTDSFIMVPVQPALPPAVTNVPREDIHGYVHSKKVNKYLIGPTLGEGSFAKVKEAFHELVGEKVAIKIIDKKKAQEDPYVAKNFKREAKLLQKLSHPNIVRLYEVVETPHNYYLVTELCTGGDLMKYIYKCGRLSEEETKKYIMQLVSAVDHLHRAGLIHRDLKVENLLLDHGKNLKLIDFGLSNEEYIRDQSGSEVHCRTQCGSPAYAAPELLGQKQYDRSVDIWSIGVNMYAMLTGMLPFTVEPFNITALHAKMLQNKMNPIPEHISENCKDLLQKLLIASPERRITMPDIFTHPWFQEEQVPPFSPAPYPNHLTSEKINANIIEHMLGSMELETTEVEIRHDLMTNRATSSYSIYHLMQARLARYEREFPQKSRSKSEVVHRTRNSESTDDDDDIMLATSRLASRDGSRKTASSGGVTLRHSTPKQKTRPVSDIIPPTFTSPISNVRRLSNIMEERRGSAPPQVIAEDIEKIRKLPQQQQQRPVTQHQGTRPPLTKTQTFDERIRKITPPPHDPNYKHRRSSSLKRNHKSLPRNMDIQAWQSNPPSTANSRASSRSNIHVPPLHKMGSVSGLSDDDDLEFHDVPTPSSPMRVNFTTGSGSGSPTDTPPPIKEPTHLPPIKTSAKRKNGFVMPLNGDYTIKTNLQVSEIVGEVLRVAHVLHMKNVEPLTINKLHCHHKSVDFEVAVRKSSFTSCVLHFEWLHGGSTKQFNDVCHELLQKLTL